MKIIAFSLWGKDPKYCIGAIKNANLCNSVYPGWISRFYCSTDVPTNIIDALKKIDNTEVVIVDSTGWNGMFWRFYPCSEEDVSVMLSRDCDSRLNMREKAAVDEWLESDKRFLSLKDHPYHNIPILGGMWGCKYPLLKDMKTMIDKYDKGGFWQVDQNFLTSIIYPIVKDTMLIFDEFYDGLKFKTERTDYEFIGDSFDALDNRHPEYWKILKNNLK